MGAVTREPQPLRGAPTDRLRPVAVPAPGRPDSPSGQDGAAGPSLVVIVAASRAEQQRLLASLPADVPVLVTSTAEQAEELLHTLPVPVGSTSAAGPPVRAAGRDVSWGDGRSVRLTPLEFALLQTLSLEQGRVWSFAELSRRVWATGFVGDGAQVRAVVKRLRRKLADAQAPVLVETVRGAGFRLAHHPGPWVS